jgi:DNA-binding NtrC family response regulator
MVRKGDFREDLFYRLKVFPIHLPPLRERKEDVGLLIDHFIKKFNTQTGKSITGLTSEAAVTMMDYCWPGNIRELENAIEHAFVTCHEKEIGIFDLPLEIRHVEMRSTLCHPSNQQPTKNVKLQTGKRKLTEDDLRAELDRFKGNRAETAKALGIDRTTLWRYMKRWGIGDR